MLGEVSVAVGDPVEPGLRAEHREPRRPRVGGHQVAAVAAGQRDLEQVPGVQAEDRPAVRGEVSYPREPARYLTRGVQRGRVQQVMYLPGLAVALVDRRYLGRQHEPDRRPARRWQPEQDRLLELRAQPEQPRLGGHEVGAKLLAPRRMREVAGPAYGDPLAPGPPCQVLEVAVPAARA